MHCKDRIYTQYTMSLSSTGRYTYTVICSIPISASQTNKGFIDFFSALMLCIKSLDIHDFYKGKVTLLIQATLAWKACYVTVITLSRSKFGCMRRSDSLQFSGRDWSSILQSTVNTGWIHCNSTKIHRSIPHGLFINTNTCWLLGVEQAQKIHPDCSLMHTPTKIGYSRA